jgi:hypothetical protein
VKTKPIPIDKTCRICRQKKLLSEFDVDEETTDLHSIICKSCDDLALTCPGYLKSKILVNAYTQLDLLLSLVNDGLELPDDLVDLLSEIAHRGGMKCPYDDCNKKFS